MAGPPGHGILGPWLNFSSPVLRWVSGFPSVCLVGRGDYRGCSTETTQKHLESSQLSINGPGSKRRRDSLSFPPGSWRVLAR